MVSTQVDTINNKGRPWVDTRSPDGLNGIGSPME